MRRSPVWRHFVLSIARNGSSYEALASTSSIYAAKPSFYIYLAHSPSGSLRIETADRRNLEAEEHELNQVHFLEITKYLGLQIAQ